MEHWTLLRVPYFLKSINCILMRSTYLKNAISYHNV